MRRLKLFLAVLGWTLAVVGTALDLRPLVWVAMAVLATALAMRLWERRHRSSPSDTPGN
jgi:uncharacterized membrane protein